MFHSTLHVCGKTYDQTPHNDRFCPVCNSGIIEEESHFLLHCPKYSIPREKFYNQIQHNFVDFNELSSTELLIRLMNSQNFSLNSHLLKFVSLCNDLRNNFLLSNHTFCWWHLIDRCDHSIVVISINCNFVFKLVILYLHSHAKSLNCCCCWHQAFFWRKFVYESCILVMKYVKKNLFLQVPAGEQNWRASAWNFHRFN